MSYKTALQLVGGQGGSYFYFSGERSGAKLKKIWVWVGGWQVKAIQVWLTDGQNQLFGRPTGDPSEFQFGAGEHMTSLTLWSSGGGTRLGAIRFTTNRSREFYACMNDSGMKIEYPIDVGSGVCLGVAGRACADIDCLGFTFNNMQPTKLVYFDGVYEKRTCNFCKREKSPVD
uniref:Jacalin-type lectin domain-containing protein n=1 Tax=Anabas testudineus TaxID=64144 RepID=A0A7N6A823_ANATE